MDAEGETEMTNGNKGKQKTLPFVLRAQMVPGLRWALSVDEAGNFSQPISRAYDLPAFRANGTTLTDQHAMRRGIIMTEAQHHRALQKRYPGAIEIASIGDGNLTANFGFVAYSDGHLFCLAGEAVYRNRYTCLVAWKDGHLTVEDIWFVKEYGEVRVECKDNGRVRDITDEVDFVTSGQALIRNREKVPLDQIAELFYDTRHLLNPIRFAINGSALFLPNAQLQHGLLRKAVDGPVRIALEAQVDEETALPLSVKRLRELAETRPAELEKTAAFLRRHQMLAEGEKLREPAVLLRVAEQIEQLLAKSLAASGYSVIENLGPLREGDVCFVNGHMEVFFRKAIYPHNIFVRWADGSCGAVVWPGKSGREGTTLPEAQQYLTEVLGVEDAVLLDNGGDVRLTFRGCELVRSSEKRPQIALLAENGGSVAGAVQVQ
jgi:hypothetical protein